VAGRMKVFLPTLLLIVACSTVVRGQFVDLSSVDFKKADSIAELYPLHSLKDLKILSDKLTRPLTGDLEKFRAIFKWVCISIDIDYELYLENKKQREKLDGDELRSWEKKFSARTFNILVLGHRTVCTGYAYLVKELAFHAGLTCKIIDGYGRNVKANIGGLGTANHSWNAVQLNGKWYLSDPTWSSGVINAELRTFVKKFDDAYFLVEPELFARNHYPLDTTWLLVDKKPTLRSFLNGPLLYIGAFRYQVEPLSPDTFNVTTNRGTKLSFRFIKDSGKDFKKAQLYVEKSGTNDPFTINKVEQETVYSVDHTFSGRGRYAVHILLDGSHAITFDVSVK
jgi:hypothetical protein